MDKLLEILTMDDAVAHVRGEKTIKNSSFSDKDIIRFYEANLDRWERRQLELYFMEVFYEKKKVGISFSDEDIIRFIENNLDVFEKGNVIQYIYDTYIHEPQAPELPQPEFIHPPIPITPTLPVLPLLPTIIEKIIYLPSPEKIIYLPSPEKIIYLPAPKVIVPMIIIPKLIPKFIWDLIQENEAQAAEISRLEDYEMDVPALVSQIDTLVSQIDTLKEKNNAQGTHILKLQNTLQWKFEKAFDYVEWVERVTQDWTVSEDTTIHFTVPGEEDGEPIPEWKLNFDYEMEEWFDGERWHINITHVFFEGYWYDLNNTADYFFLPKEVVIYRLEVEAALEKEYYGY